MVITILYIFYTESSYLVICMWINYSGHITSLQANHFLFCCHTFSQVDRIITSQHSCQGGRRLVHACMLHWFMTVITWKHQNDQKNSYVAWVKLHDSVQYIIIIIDLAHAASAIHTFPTHSTLWRTFHKFQSGTKYNIISIGYTTYTRSTCIFNLYHIEAVNYYLFCVNYSVQHASSVQKYIVESDVMWYNTTTKS